MADIPTYDEDVICERLRLFVEDAHIFKSVSDQVPRTLQTDHMPYVFFLPGKASYSKRGAEFWTTTREYRCFVVATVATMDDDFEAARTASRLLASARQLFMSTERLVLENGTAFNVTPLGDTGLKPERRNDVLRYVVELSLQVKSEEFIVNKGQ